MIFIELTNCTYNTLMSFRVSTIYAVFDHKGHTEIELKNGSKHSVTEKYDEVMDTIFELQG